MEPEIFMSSPTAVPAPRSCKSELRLWLQLRQITITSLASMIFYIYKISSSLWYSKKKGAPEPEFAIPALAPRGNLILNLRISAPAPHQLATSAIHYFRCTVEKNILLTMFQS